MSAGLFGLLVLSGVAHAAEVPPPVAGAGTLRDGDGDGCGAVLIAPDLALTAAHCAADLRDRINARPGAILFLTGAYRDHPTVEREVVDVIEHPLFMDRTRPLAARLQADIAILKLNRPIPDTVARPFPVTAAVPGAGSDVMVAAWLGDQSFRAQERPCELLAAEEWLTTLSCRVFTGESGSPVLADTEDGLALVGILSARTQVGGQPLAFAVLAAPRIGQLEALISSRAEVLNPGN